MNPRTTGLLALVAAILGGFIYFYEIQGEPARESLREDERRVHPGFEAEDVEALELETKDGLDARFERRDGRWRIVSPVSGRADATALDAIAHALTSLPRAGSVEDPGERAQYGLGTDARAVRFWVEGESRGVLIGKATPVGGRVYIAVEGDVSGEVLYVDRYRINALNRSLHELRDRRIFGFDAGEVRTLRLSWPAAEAETEVALAQDASGQWQMGVPVVGRADPLTVRELLSDLSFLRAKGFVDERTEAIESALADSPLTIHWTLEADHVERRARIGAVFEEDVLVEGPSGELHTIAVERMDDFKRTVNDYRFKMLSEFELDKARRLILEFTSEGGESMRVVASLVESGWTGEPPRIDPDRAYGLIRALAGLRAEDIFADEMGPNELASLGLAPPRARIRIEDRAAPDDATQVLAEIAIGRFDEERGLFAQRVGKAGGPEGSETAKVFILPISLVAALPISREAFMRDFEAPDFEAADQDVDGEELDFEGLTADPMEGVEIP